MSEFSSAMDLDLEDGVLPTYVSSPDMSLYISATSPVTPVQPLDSEFLSPGVQCLWITSSRVTVP